MTPTDLIARLEEATEGGRELDAALEVVKRAWDAEKAGVAPEHAAQWRHLGTGWVGDDHTKYMAPRYSTSIDAALLLVPGDWRLEHLGEQLHLPQMWECELHNRNEEQAIQGEAATPALAICIAALKARETKEN